LSDGLLFPVSRCFLKIILSTLESLRYYFDVNNSDFNADRSFQNEDEKKVVDEDSEPTGICCANCHAHLTDKKNAITIEGRHLHVVTNPAGIIFQIGTFSTVDCRAESDVDDEFSWFSGYAWRIVSCSSCLQHIGWSYQHEHSPDFYGLIVDKLIDFDK